MKWISIKDDLPEYDWVLVCCATQKDSPICLARRYAKSQLFPDGKWEFWDIRGCGPYCGDAFSFMTVESITHWMDLPDLPQNMKNKIDLNIVDMFNEACIFIVQEGNKDYEYEFAENTILTALNYFKGKRSEPESESNARECRNCGAYLQRDH